MNTQSSSNADLAVRPQPEINPERPGYFVAGAGTPVVMLHASLSSKSQWTTLAERMARRYRVIAIDLCGYGDNAVMTGGTWFTVDDEVRLITAHLDNIVEPHVRVHVVGHSYGGLVALRFAQCRRERVASLSLYEPVAFRMLDVEDAALGEIKRRAERVAQLVMAGRHDAAQAFVDFWTSEGSFASLPLPAQGSMARRIDKVPLDFQAAWRWPLGPTELHAIVAPTLLLAGHRSPAVAQRIVTSLTRVLPDRRVGWFDCGHMGPITDAHRINPWIEAFVESCAARDATAAAPRARHAGVVASNGGLRIPTLQETAVDTYQFPTPRIAFGFAAVAMTAITIGVLVVLPSRMESDSQVYAMLAASTNTVQPCVAPLPNASLGDRTGRGVYEPSQPERLASCAARPVARMGHKTG